VCEQVDADRLTDRQTDQQPDKYKYERLRPAVPRIDAWKNRQAHHTQVMDVCREKQTVRQTGRQGSKKVKRQDTRSGTAGALVRVSVPTVCSTAQHGTRRTAWVSALHTMCVGERGWVGYEGMKGWTNRQDGTLRYATYATTALDNTVQPTQSACLPVHTPLHPSHHPLTHCSAHTRIRCCLSACLWVSRRSSDE